VKEKDQSIRGVQDIYARRKGDGQIPELLQNTSKVGGGGEL